MPTLPAAFLAALLAIVAGLVLYRRVLAAPTSTPRANEIAAAIRTGRRGLPLPPVPDRRDGRRPDPAR